MSTKQSLASQKISPSAERIERCILMIRGEKVMFDADLAELYGGSQQSIRADGQAKCRPVSGGFHVPTYTRRVRQLEVTVCDLKLGGRRYPPYAFTEHGIAMLSSVLRSSRAVQVNIEIMRAFIRLRRMLASHTDLSRRLDGLETKYDTQLRVIFDAIRQLMAPSERPRRSIGFKVEAARPVYRRRPLRRRGQAGERSERSRGKVADITRGIWRSKNPDQEHPGTIACKGVRYLLAGLLYMEERAYFPPGVIAA